MTMTAASVIMANVSLNFGFGPVDCEGSGEARTLLGCGDVVGREVDAVSVDSVREEVLRLAEELRVSMVDDGEGVGGCEVEGVSPKAVGVMVT